MHLNDVPDRHPAVRGGQAYSVAVQLFHCWKYKKMVEKLQATVMKWWKKNFGVMKAAVIFKILLR